VVVSLLQVDHPSGITTLFEAMAMGRAVVASHVGSTSHAIKSGENGLLVAVGDVSAMRAALTSLMQNEPLRRLLGNNARTTIETDFSYVSFVQRFAASLRSVVERV
jgi:glycosyltransferase involved in cell wall biosynthesis